MNIDVDRPVGIDLGTTNSAIALLEPSEANILTWTDKFGRRTMPSAVAYSEESASFIVGRNARRMRGKSVVLESVKRQMGRNVKVMCGPEELLPEDIAEKILVALRQNMTGYLAERAASGTRLLVNRAVVTVPAYFDAPQIDATRRAVEKSGLEPLGILQEPTAAAIYHTFVSGLGDGNFLVYDFGGGTFDVSIVRCMAGEYQVLAIDGDNYLGGDDLDRRFAEHLRGRLSEQGYSLDLDLQGEPDDVVRFGRLVHVAQEIKEALSTSQVVAFSRQNVLNDKDGEPVDIEMEFGRKEYEKQVADLVGRTIAACERAIAESSRNAGVGPDAIDQVILVGGSTRLPLVIKRVTEVLCGPARCDGPLQDEVDTCVALGAAIHAAHLGGLKLANGSVTVGLHGPLVSDRAQIAVQCVAEAVPGGAAHLEVRDSADAPVDRHRIDSTTPMSLDVPLTDDASQTFALVVLGAEGNELGRVNTAFFRGDVRARASALSRPAVIAKAISVETIRGGRRASKELMPKGMGLPAEVHHVFATSDVSGAVVIRLLQGRLPVCTLVVEVPVGTPVGTPVELRLTCDDAMRIEAEATVAGKRLWAQVDMHERDENFDRVAVAALLETVERLNRELWGYRQNGFRSRSEPLVAQVKEAITNDPDKLQVLCGRLRQLTVDFEGVGDGVLKPSMEEFEGELDRVRRTVYSAQGSLVGMSREQWEERLKDIQTRADEIASDQDQGRWRRLNNEVQALRETAAQQAYVARDLYGEDELVAYHGRIRIWARQSAEKIQDVALSSAPEVQARQRTERDRLLTQLHQEVVTPLASLTIDAEHAGREVRRKIDDLSEKLERIDAAVARLPNLGMITDTGR